MFINGFNIPKTFQTTENLLLAQSAGSSTFHTYFPFTPTLECFASLLEVVDGANDWKQLP